MARANQLMVPTAPGYGKSSNPVQAAPNSILCWQLIGGLLAGFEVVALVGPGGT